MIMRKIRIEILLHRLYDNLRTQMKSKWKRDIPFNELLFDRWERAKKLGFGDGSNIYHYSYVYGEVVVGKNCWIGPYTMLDGTGGLTIGDYCCISSGVHIYTHDTVKRFVSGGHAPTELASVKIMSNCYIGPQSIISKGVEIGEHSIVGANSFVTKSVPPLSIVAGNPAKKIGTVKIDGSKAISFEYL
jgi:acetyltransferase-like isoleucine patch superfamily enzyme